jgi:hypothetical protein
MAGRSRCRGFAREKQSAEKAKAKIDQDAEHEERRQMKKVKHSLSDILEILPAKETQDSRDLEKYLSQPRMKLVLKMTKNMAAENGAPVFLCSKLTEHLTKQAEEMEKTMSPTEITDYLNASIH